MTPVRTLSELLDERVEKTPDALSCEQEINGGMDSATWREFRRRADALSLALEELGLRPGECAAVMGQTTIEWGVADLGILGAGGVSVGVYSTLTPQHVAYILRDCQAVMAFVGSAAELESMREAAKVAGVCPIIVGWGGAERRGATDFSQLLARGTQLLREKPTRIGELRQVRGPEDLALLIYTSGTTGTPKGAMLSHRNCITLLKELEPLMPPDLLGTDTTVSFLPMAHVAEHIAGFYGRINAGYSARYVGSLDSNAVMAAVTATRPTVFGSVPRIFEKAYARIRATIAARRPRQRRIFAWAENVGRRMSRHRLAGTTPPFTLRVQHRLADRLVLSRIRAAFGGG